MNNFDSAFKKVSELVEDFKQNQKHYLSPEYQEAEVRRDFIDKFFEALGWDVYHNTQKNPYEQEVKVEKGVSVGKAQKRADYAFYISPEFRQPKFFAEAKKPNRNLKNADDYFQTIRYGWNANTPIAVLTDFEEFHILDCRFKPNINYVLENPNYKIYLYTDYVNEEKFKEIYYLFSRESVLANSLQKYSESFPKPKVKKTGKEIIKSTFKAIDDDFLEYIDGVREHLAKAFKKTDSSLSSEELTEATQRTIDRIVFIRFLEDKLIEPDYIINEFGKRGNPWTDFITVSRKLDAKYNGIVFKKHFIDEQNFAGPEIKEFSRICEDISHLNSPYDFNAIPIHILGSIYERFLGKVVNATAQRVKVEEKPEVRKAGGVYYTPKYIVDYIVENTVGKILKPCQSDSDLSSEQSPPLSSRRILGRDPLTTQDQSDSKAIATGKTPAEISKLRFADIACGSGSFLIGVFETLLKYHSEYYQQHPEQAKKDGCIEKDGKMVLSIKQKQNILLNNIYGVDIDSQAVEVTQLSLALKMLEDESTATANDMQVLFHEKILPDLSKNIVCGNSLIGTDILSGNMFASDEERKLNPMDFETMFPHIFKDKNPGSVIPAKAGIQKKEGSPAVASAEAGFDAIVGNPPYLKERGSKEIFEPIIKSKFGKLYHQGKMDLWYYFVHKAIDICKDKGFIGFITNSYWLKSDGASKLINRIKEKLVFDIIIDFENLKIFDNVSGKHMISIFKKSIDKQYLCNIYKVDVNKLDENIDSYAKIKIPNDILFSDVDKINININESFFRNTEFLSYHFDTSVGVQESTDKISRKQIEQIKRKNDFKVGDGVFVLNIDEIKKLNLSKNEIEIVKPYLNTSHVGRYFIDFRNEYLIYSNNLTREKIKKNIYPNIKNHLDKLKEFITSSNKPYGIHRPREQKFFESPKLICKGMFAEPEFSYDENKFYCGFSFSVIIKKSNKYNLKYLLGLMNSKVGKYWFTNNGKKRGIGVDVGVKVFRFFPIPILDMKNESEKQSHDLIVSLVDQMLSAKKQLHTAKTDKDKTYYERKCESLDQQIDSEVYKLYNLTDKEINIVEGKE
jgi:adenine-specific DNA-methyltransferase